MWLYVLQILVFNIPLTLYLGRCLDLANAGKDPRTPTRRSAANAWLWPIVWLLDHGVFLAVVVFQAYLVLSGFYLAYGGLALVLCPLRTWAIFLAVYLRHTAMGGTELPCFTDGGREPRSPLPTLPQNEDDTVSADHQVPLNSQYGGEERTDHESSSS